ncbi:MAG: DNA-3-methyladenine glycosylase family protein, partial [Actinomycetota bacterium]
MLELRADDDHVVCKLRLSDPRDLGTVLHRCRRLLDLDADPSGIDEVLGAHPALAPLVRETPGRRVPGAIDPHELAVRAVLGQQVSVAAARTIARRLARLCGAPVSGNGGGLSRLFPSAEAIADADLSVLGVPGTRRRTLQTLAAALARGDVVLDAGSDRQQAQRALRALPGIGPWTASY